MDSLFLAALTLLFAQGLAGRDADPARLLAAVAVAGLPPLRTRAMRTTNSPRRNPPDG
ncbi:MAG: hypothetical protein IT424_04710 [Pirellulales bacterium]|nr:hypothetical protein [Pirellulales bacterium]